MVQVFMQQPILKTNIVLDVYLKCTVHFERLLIYLKCNVYLERLRLDVKCNVHIGRLRLGLLWQDILEDCDLILNLLHHV